jgi:hypothetical protein
MLNRSQIMTLIMMRNRENNIFSKGNLPVEMSNHIIQSGDLAHDPESKIAKLLHYVAYGDPINVKKMLDQDVRLLLEASNVKDPAGNLILRVTPYECALGAGDDGMAKIIQSYFLLIEEGEKEEARQYARYKPYIDNLMTQSSYDLTELFNVLKNSNHYEVKAALEFDEHKSCLQNALDEFRKAFAPRIITEGMHFNYQNLLNAYLVFMIEFEKLKLYWHNFDKCLLLWRQMIGYIQRGLPACDRQAFAQGIYYIAIMGEKLKRSFDERTGTGQFPITDNNKIVTLGYQASFGDCGRQLTIIVDVKTLRDAWTAFDNLCRTKTANLQNLCKQSENNLRLTF